MTAWSRTRRSVVCGLLGVALVAAACGNGATARSEDAQGDGLSALTASFDAAVGPPQRYLVGLFTQDQGNIVDGSVSVSFRYLGSGSGSGAEDPQIGESEARFVATAGFEQRPQTSSPHVAGPGEGVGAYEVPEVSFDRAGIREATVEAVIDGVTETTTDAFDVADQHSVPVAGDTSPTPTQPLAGDPTVSPAAIDSRASNSEPISDRELHSITVADAIASRRPTLVVVSTPTYCVSRFCGPITDTVATLADEYGGRANFVHLEVWSNFESNELNPASSEFINGSGEGNEPWVFLIDGEGTIVERWDNVANADLLRNALERQVG